MRASAALTPPFSLTCSTPPNLFKADLPKGRASDRSLNVLIHVAIACVTELDDGGDARSIIFKFERCCKD